MGVCDSCCPPQAEGAPEIEVTASPPAAVEGIGEVPSVAPSEVGASPAPLEEAAGLVPYPPPEGGPPPTGETPAMPPGSPIPIPEGGMQPEVRIGPLEEAPRPPGAEEVPIASPAEAVSPTVIEGAAAAPEVGVQPPAEVPAAKPLFTPAPEKKPVEAIAMSLGATPEPTIPGDDALYIYWHEKDGGSILQRFAHKAPDKCLMVVRYHEPIPEHKYNEQPYQVTSKVRAEWGQQAKALCGILRSAAVAKGEVQLLPAFWEILPRKGMLLLHRESDDELVTLMHPSAFDFSSTLIDGVACLPYGADVYRGLGKPKLKVFLEKGVRRGATNRVK